jgi:hypothetical protein
MQRQPIPPLEGAGVVDEVVVEVEVLVVVDEVVVLVLVLVDVVDVVVVPTGHGLTGWVAGGAWVKQPPGPTIASCTVCVVPPGSVTASVLPPWCDCEAISHCQ